MPPTGGTDAATFSMKSQCKVYWPFSPLSSFQPPDKCAPMPPSLSGSGASSMKTFWVRGMVCFQFFSGLHLQLRRFLKALLCYHRCAEADKALSQVHPPPPKASKGHFSSAKDYFGCGKQMSHYGSKLLILKKISWIAAKLCSYDNQMNSAASPYSQQKSGQMKGKRKRSGSSQFFLRNR